MGRFTLIFVAVLGVVAASPRKDATCTFPFEMIGTQCLLIDTLEKGKWYDMRLFCRDKAPGAGLARITDPSQLKKIIDYINKNALTDANFWIDGSDMDHEGVWVWSDGTPLPMGAPLWRYDCGSTVVMRPLNDPSLNCAYLDKQSHHLMADTACDGTIGQIPYNPICEIYL